MKINVTSNEFKDLILLLLFVDIVSIDDIPESNYKKFLNKMIGTGFRSRLFDFYMNTSPQLRVSLRYLLKTFEKDSNIINNINVFPNPLVNESTSDEYEKYAERLIEETIKTVVNKENPNPEKVEQTKQKVFDRLNEIYGAENE